MRILKRRAEPRLMNAGFSSQIVADNFPFAQANHDGAAKHFLRVYDNFRPRINYPGTPK